MNKGFTLIELLVVVLIIGILAAIALPQYTKAVERSRISEAAQRLGDMATAAQIHYMQNGSFPAQADYKTATDVTFGTLSTASYNVTASGSTSGGTITATRTSGKYQNEGIQMRLKTDGSIEKVAIGTNAEYNGMIKGFGYGN